MYEILYSAFSHDFNAPYIPQCAPDDQATYLQEFMGWHSPAWHQLKWLLLVQHETVAIEKCKSHNFALVQLFTQIEHFMCHNSISFASFVVIFAQAMQNNYRKRLSKPQYEKLPCL